MCVFVFDVWEFYLKWFSLISIAVLAAYDVLVRKRETVYITFVPTSIVTASISI